MHQLFGHLGQQHGREIADALAKKMAAVKVLPRTSRKRVCCLHRSRGRRCGLQHDRRGPEERPGVTDYGQAHRDGVAPTVVKKERCVTFCRPWSPRFPRALGVKKEYMFRFVTVVECPEERCSASTALVCSMITDKRRELREAFIDATHIDRLNLGAHSDDPTQLAGHGGISWTSCSALRLPVGITPREGTRARQPRVEAS
ncbi:MAG: hypothetical protein U1D30_17135 [Planctomycetota bacterium]